MKTGTPVDRLEIELVTGAGWCVASAAPPNEIRAARIPSRSEAQLFSAAPDLLAVLREVEWSGGGVEFIECPSCSGAQSLGHEPGCRLAAALRKAEGK